MYYVRDVKKAYFGKTYFIALGQKAHFGITYFLPLEQNLEKPYFIVRKLI